MSLLTEIKGHIDNIINRINNVYNLDKYDKLFNEYGNIKDIESLKELINKLNIENEIEQIKSLKINDIYNKVDMDSLNLERTTNLSKIELMNNLENKNIDSVGYERIINLISDRIKVINRITGDLEKIKNQINIKIIEMKAKSEIIIKETDYKIVESKSTDTNEIEIEKIFEKYNIREIYKISEELGKIKDEILLSFDLTNKNWYKKQKGGNNIIDYNKANYNYLESITKLKKIYSDILESYKEYNKLSAEFILYLLLILELYKKIENEPNKVNRYISLNDITIYKSQIKNYKIFENDIFIKRVNKILETIEKVLRERNNKFIDLYESNNQIEIFLLDMIMNKI
jgi:hypothetical protein